LSKWGEVPTTTSHAFASRLLAAGVDVVTISQLLGHSAATVTLLYTHTNPRLMRQAVDTLSVTGEKMSGHAPDK
jgi:site-specific recombinase XerD